MMTQSKRPSKPYALMTALILGAALSACATVPEVREIEGPIVLNAPDSVVRGDDTALPPVQPQTTPVDDDYGYETVQTVPVTPITCPAGTSPHSDGSCMMVN